MPINFACPACGKQSLVEDKYAGQSGPCSGCGKTITVPTAGGGVNSPFPAPGGLPPAGYYAPAPKSSGGGYTLAIILGVCCLGLLFCGGILVALLLPAVQQARGAARRSASSNNLKQISLAMHNYHDTFREFPPAFVTDKSGKPLYSGYVLLLPFLEQSAIYNQFKFDEAWDSPSNLALSSIAIPTFQNPALPGQSPERCDYLIVGGTGSALDPAIKGKHSMMNITDGTSNTMMLVETKTSSRSWAEPRVWDSTQPFDGPSNGVVVIALFDASVRAVPKTTDRETLKKLESAAGGEIVNLP